MSVQRDKKRPAIEKSNFYFEGFAQDAYSKVSIETLMRTTSTDDAVWNRKVHTYHKIRGKKDKYSLDMDLSILERKQEDSGTKGSIVDVRLSLFPRSLRVIRHDLYLESEGIAKVDTSSPENHLFSIVAALGLHEPTSSKRRAEIARKLEWYKSEEMEKFRVPLQSEIKKLDALLIATKGVTDVLTEHIFRKRIKPYVTYKAETT